MNIISSELKKVGVVIVSVMVLLALLVGVVALNIYTKQSINYNLVYKQKVEETVRKMVKPEYLKLEYRK